MGTPDAIMKPLVPEKSGPMLKSEYEKATALEKLKEVKSEYEKGPLEKLKQEHKEVKSEMEKLPWYEHKAYFKELALEKLAPEKPPVPEKPVVGEKGAGGTEAPPPVVDDATKAALSQHADALEAAAGNLRHFIETSSRPDLSKGALGAEATESEPAEPA